MHLRYVLPTVIILLVLLAILSAGTYFLYFFRLDSSNLPFMEKCPAVPLPPGHGLIVVTNVGWQTIKEMSVALRDTKIVIRDLPGNHTSSSHEIPDDLSGEFVLTVNVCYIDNQCRSEQCHCNFGEANYSPVLLLSVNDGGSISVQ